MSGHSLRCPILSRVTGLYHVQCSYQIQKGDRRIPLTKTIHRAPFQSSRFLPHPQIAPLFVQHSRPFSGSGANFVKIIREGETVPGTACEVNRNWPVHTSGVLRFLGD